MPTVSLRSVFLWPDRNPDKNIRQEPRQEHKVLSKSAGTKQLSTSGIGRITARPDYMAIAGSGRKWITPSFVLQALPGDDKHAARVGFTVSKKVGNAVKRSRARRRLKEAARTSFPQNAPDGWAFVLVGRATAIEYPFEKMCADMRWALAKLSANADLKTSGTHGKKARRSR